MFCASLSLVTLNGICHIGPMPTTYILGRHSLLASKLIGSGCFCSCNITSHIVSPSVLLPPSSRTLHTFIILKINTRIKSFEILVVWQQEILGDISQVSVHHYVYQSNKRVLKQNSRHTLIQLCNR